MRSIEAVLNEIEIMVLNTTHAKYKLLSLMRHENSEIRFRAIEKLGSVLQNINLTTDVCQLLRATLSDKDELVRCAVLEVLSEHPQCIAVEEIIELLSDQSALVRGGAAEVLGWWGEKKAEGDILRAILVADDVEKAPMYFALSLLKNSLGMDGLLGLLNSSDYRTRCAVANLLPNCVSQNNRDEVISALSDTLDSEQTVAARSSLMNALKELEINT